MVKNEDKEMEIRIILSTKVLGNIQDKSVENILRSIVFNPNNSIDWESAFKEILINMPELTYKQQKQKI